MRLKNTSRYDTALARSLIEFGMRGVGTSALSVHLKNSSDAYRGMSYNGIPSMARVAKTSRDLITIGVGEPDLFPKEGIQYPGLKTAPTYDLGCWQEALVVLAAHEAYHHKVHRANRSHHERRAAAFRSGAFSVPVKERANSEVKAERWALRRLNAFRETHDCPDA